MKRSERLAKFYPKEAKQWTQNKEENLRVAAMYKSSPAHQREAERMCRCSDWLGEQMAVDPETGEVTKSIIKSVSLCHLRYCPTCQKMRARKWYAILRPVIQHILDILPSAHFVYLDLTRKNCPVTELRATIQAMNKAYQRLMERKECSQVVTGWIRITEVTKGDDDNAHPHFHCILLLSPSYIGTKYIKKERFRKLWRESLQVDYDPDIFVRHIKKQDDMVLELSERLSYITKPMEQITDEDWLIAITEQTARLHFVVCGGRFKVVRKKIKREKEMPVHSEKEHIATFQWDREDKNYIHLDILYMI